MDLHPDRHRRISSNWTLEDYVMELFRSKATHSREFKAMLEIYGREKLEAIWKKFKKEETRNQR